MSKFITPLSIKYITDKVFELTAPLVYYSNSFGDICIDAGFRSDGASVPRLPIVYNLWGNRAHREAVLHDAAFRKDFPWQLSFCDSNRLFLEAMGAAGKPFYIRYPLFFGVCLGGWASYHKKRMADVLV